MRRGRTGERGFTQLELVVVLAIVALALAVVVPSVARTRAGLDLRSAAHEMASHLRAVRAAAQRSNVERAMHIDAAARRYTAEGAAANAYLPASLHLELQLPDSERSGATAGRVRFFPDGSASGGRIVLRDARSTATVSVDWLNGDVRLQVRE